MEVHTFIARLIRHIPDKHFPDGVFYALKNFSGSKRDNHSFASVMIVTRAWLSPEPIKTFTEKLPKLIPKPWILIQKLFGYDHYSIVPLFQHSMETAQIEVVIKIIVNSYGYRNSETFIEPDGKTMAIPCAGLARRKDT